MLEEPNWRLLLHKFGGRSKMVQDAIRIFSTGGVFLKNFLARAPCRWFVAGVEKLAGAPEFN